MLETGLNGKTALITGGATGIGFGIAKALAAEGVEIAIASRNPDSAVVNEIMALGVRCHLIPTDVGEEEQVNAMVHKAIAAMGSVDLYVNNAAAHWDAPVTKITSEQWLNSINVNLSACVFACREVSKHMIGRGTGNILVIGSTAVVSPLPMETGYRVSKAGLRSYTQLLAIELAAFGLRVNMLTPGAFLTSMTQDLDERLSTDLIERDVPLRSMGLPEQIGATALLLLSDQLSPYTTGADYVVDGGLSLRPYPFFAHDEIQRMNTPD